MQAPQLMRLAGSLLLLLSGQVVQGVQLSDGSHGTEHAPGHMLLAANRSAWGAIENVLPAGEYLLHDAESNVEKFLERARLEAQTAIDTVLFGAVPGGPDQGLHFRPVSVTLWLVMILTFVALVVHLLHSAFRNADELSGDFTTSLPTKTMTVAARPVAFVPMLCMLFVACRMYVLAQTEGLGEPQPWAKASMFIASFGMLLQLVVVLVLPGFTMNNGAAEAEYKMTDVSKPLPTHAAPSQGGTSRMSSPRSPGSPTATERSWRAEVTPADPDPEEPEAEDGEDIVATTGDVPDAHPTLHRVQFREEVLAAKWVFWGLQLLSIIALYGGIFGVMLGMATFPQARQTSPAIICTVVMAIPYFLVHLKLWFGRNFASEGLLEQMALAMSTPIRKAPMFCVVFLFSRMRALELDPPHGMPSDMGTLCFYACTAAFLLEIVFAAINVAYGAEQKKVYYGQYFFEAQENKMPVVLMSALAMVSYLAFIGIAVESTLLTTAGSDAAAPLSTTGRCTLALASVFFVVAALQSGLNMVEALDLVEEQPVKRDTFVAAGISLSLAPIVCILFVATRMRALQITQAHGDPPGWAQDCMLMCSFAVCLQSVCCLVMPIFIGSSVKVDEDGNPDYDLKPMVGAYAVTIVKYVALIALYGGVGAISAAVFLMTPETANSSGRVLTSTRAFVKAMGITSLVFFLSLLLSSAKVVGLAVKFAIEACDQAVLGVDINVRHVAFSLGKGYVKISDLVVDQPPQPETCQWSKDYLAKVKLILVKINLWRIITTLGKEIEIENISLEGLHVNIEKPNTKMSEPNSNVEFVQRKINEGLGHFGLDLDQLAAMQVDMPPIDGQLILRKIKIGDIGVGCYVHAVPMIGHISFHPRVPILEFNDVQKEVCGGREDIAPGLMVALIIKAIVGKIFVHVGAEIPAQLARASAQSAKAGVGRVMTGVKSLVRSVTGHIATEG